VAYLGALPLGVGVAAFILIDVPNAVPRNLGRKIHAHLASKQALDKTNGQSRTFASAQADRISYETRKVLTISGDDLRHRFRSALERSTQERKEVEDKISAAEAAVAWLVEFSSEVEGQVKRVEAIDLGEVKA
jgi:mitofusin